MALLQVMGGRRKAFKETYQHSAARLQIPEASFYAKDVKHTVTILFALLLSWSMLPGGTELAENACHLVIHGDFAHSQPLKQGHKPFDPEHGCGGGFHLCSCCHLQPSLWAGTVAAVSAGAAGEIVLSDGISCSTQDFSRGPEEPPRS